MEGLRFPLLPMGGAGEDACQGEGCFLRVHGPLATWASSEVRAAGGREEFEQHSR